MRVYGELLRQLDDDAVVIGDGGDFVSFAGRLIEPAFPGRWLDPGPYGCLGTGLGYAIAARLAHPSSQVVLMLGDGAAGLSLMDVDTLVRHNLPVVMIVGNNSAWGLEKGPMQAVYGYDVAADLRPETRYDEVVSALGGAGELVTNAGRDRLGAETRLRRVHPVPDQRDHRRRGRVPAHHHGCIGAAYRAVRAQAWAILGMTRWPRASTTWGSYSEAVSRRSRATASAARAGSVELPTRSS